MAANPSFKTEDDVTNEKALRFIAKQYALRAKVLLSEVEKQENADLETLEVTAISLKEGMEAVREISVDEAIIICDDFEKMMARANILIRKIKNKMMFSLQGINDHANKSSKINSCDEVMVSPPKIKLSEFHGEITKFKEFWDAFECAIHQNPKIPEVIKFAHLCGLLKGKAKETIEGIPITNDNYQEAVDLLKQRFLDENLAKSIVYMDLTNMPPTKSVGVSLVNTVDRINKYIRQLKAYGEDVYHTQFKTIILSKLPKEVRLKIHEIDPNYSFGVMDLLEYLNNLSKAWRINEEYSNNKDKQKIFSDDSVLMVNFQKKKKPRMSCVFCQKLHWSDECKEYITLESRKKMLRNNCYNCLRTDHVRKDCMSSKPCFHCKKVKSHHSSLCPTKYKVLSDSQESQDTVMLSNNSESKLQIFPVTLKNPRNQRYTTTINALFDTGSSKSFITEKTANELNLDRKSKMNMTVTTFGCDKKSDFESSNLEIEVTTKFGPKLMTVNTVEKISSPVKDMIIPHRIQHDSLSHLLKNSVRCTKSIEMLIGIDYFWDFVNYAKSEGTTGLYKVETKFGDMFAGRIDKDFDNDRSMSLLTLENAKESKIQFKPSEGDFNSNMHIMWSLESIGMNESENVNENDRILTEFEANLKVSQNRYKVALPWKNNHDVLPTNYGLAKGRLISLMKRLKTDPTLLKNYNEILMSQLKDGIIERVNRDGNLVKSNCHYIPHHCVTGNGETTKLRIVFDGSAKTKSSEMSLNNCLDKGPLMIEDLCGILLRFRIGSIGLTADLEKAYHQLLLRNKDKDFTRFLWVKEVDKPMEDKNIMTLRFSRVPFGLVCSPFLLHATIHHHLTTQCSLEIRNLAKSMYVDNLIHSVNSKEDATTVYKEIVKNFRCVGFNMRQWNTNDKSIRRDIDDSLLDKHPVVKVLGYNWSINEDMLKLRKVSFKDKSTLTKREIAEEVAKIYDPLGMITPCTIQLKRFMQELWREDLQWSDKLSDNLLKKWWSIVEQTKNADSIIFPRRYTHIDFSDKNSELCLICFCDASKSAYACSIYLRFENSGNIDCSMIFSKSRLAPLKELTIPKLELMAAVLGTKMITYVEKLINLRINSKYMFTDSKCVIDWIKSKKLPSLFVKNRVKEIVSHDDLIWNHVSGVENPADLATRGITVDELKNAKVWWKGPDFLYERYAKWKVSLTEYRRVSIKETSEHEGPFETLMLNSNIVSINRQYSDNLKIGLDITKFSGLRKLKRTIAWIFRFVHKLKGTCMAQEAHLEVTEIQSSEIFLIRSIQKEYFKEMMVKIEKGEIKHKSFRCDVFFDKHKIIRCGTRLANAGLSDDNTYPILLPKRSYLTTLFIRDIHTINGHCGKNQTLHLFLLKFWAPHARTLVARTIKMCQICKLHQRKPYKLPIFPNYPDYRVTVNPPFSYTGVDLAGPFTIYEANQKKKIWICLFTCATVRAIHLETVTSLSAEDFLYCLRRFTSRRGYPIMLISDNATNFKLISKVMKKAGDQKILSPSSYEAFMEDHHIQWKFVTEYSPWMGGFYERLIGLVKQCLTKMLYLKKFNYCQFSTIVTEVEHIVNLRPLIYVSSEINQTIITPSDYLCLNPRRHIQTEFNISESEYVPTGRENQSKLIAIWSKGQRILNQFWNSWKKQYLVHLRDRKERHHNQPRPTCSNIPKVGDVVHVNDLTSYNNWKLGIIKKTIANGDGEIIQANVQLSNGKMINRSLKHLSMLEI